MEIVFICAAFLALLLLRVGDAALLRRRRNWHRVQGRVLTIACIRGIFLREICGLLS